MAKPLGETEKTVLVGGLILAAWLGIDAYVSRIERRDRAATSDDTVARSSTRRRSRFGRRRRLKTA